MDGIVISDKNWEDFEPISVAFWEANREVNLASGLQFIVPLWWYPTLQQATKEQLEAVELSPSGLHWDELDEDLSVATLLKGVKAPNAVPPTEAAE
ncbi:MAG: DUF2442 domain-containing protein [Pseudomonadota bacterium]